MPRTWSTFVFDRYIPNTNCVMYNSSLSFNNLSTKSYPTGFNRDDSTGALSGPMSGCLSRYRYDQCGNFGADAGTNICPAGSDLLLRHQVGLEICGESDTFVGTQNNCCFRHNNGPTDCYYGTIDKCGKLDSTSCDLGSAKATITGYRLLDQTIDYEHQDVVKGDGLLIPQTTNASANINGEGAVACYYQYDFSDFISNGTNGRKLASWINDLYDGITYIE